MVILVSNYKIFHDFRLNKVQISLRTEHIFVVRQAFASFQHGLFRSAENVDLQYFDDVIWENVFLYNFTNMVHVFL